MRPRTHRTRRDATHGELIKALKARMGGYYKDASGGHHAYFMGLPVAAYDMHKAGRGFPDWVVWVGHVAVALEIKNPQGRRPGGALTQAGKVRAGYYTTDEVEFRSAFPGLYLTCTEQNEIYEALGKVAIGVLMIESACLQKLPEGWPSQFSALDALAGKVTLPQLQDAGWPGALPEPAP